MNQILQVQERKNKKVSNPIDTKKIVLFFAISIIVFGLIMLVEGAYSAYQEKANKKVEEKPVEPEYIEPMINLIRTVNDQITISVQSETAISHIIYEWNNQDSQTLEEDGKTNIEEIIDIPVGENTLTVTVIDINGRETKKNDTYKLEISKPDIDYSAIGKNIKVTVTSEIELSYVTCRWNSEPEQRYDMITFEDRKKFEKQLEIPKGLNTLKIVAVDINGGQSEESTTVEGIEKAKTSRPIVRGKYIHFTVTSKTYDIKTVEYVFNGKKYRMTTDTFGNTKEVKYKIEMTEGWNYLKITSTLQRDGVDTSDTTIWKYEYKPEN